MHRSLLALNQVNSWITRAFEGTNKIPLVNCPQSHIAINIFIDTDQLVSGHSYTWAVISPLYWIISGSHRQIYWIPLKTVTQLERSAPGAQLLPAIPVFPPLTYCLSYSHPLPLKSGRQLFSDREQGTDALQWMYVLGTMILILLTGKLSSALHCLLVNIVISIDSWLVILSNFSVVNSGRGIVWLIFPQKKKEKKAADSACDALVIALVVRVSL